MAEQTAATQGAAEDSGKALNRAKQWQIALFPFNNAATNLYFAFMQFFSFFAVMYLTGSTLVSAGVVVSGVIGVQVFASLFAPLMRVFDGVTDPPFGGLLDRLRTRFGKFRPFMVIGNILLATSLLTMMIFFMGVEIAWARWVVYIFGYLIFLIGYTMQCAVTRAGQSCLTNDPKQRAQFGLWNTIGMLGSIVLVNVVALGLLPGLLPDSMKGSITYIDKQGIVQTLFGAAYGRTFYYIMVPLVVILSAIYTIMAVAAISSKDKPQFWGVSKDPVKFKDYLGILRGNKELRWLVFSAGLNKLAMTVATSAAVAFLLFGGLMGDYNGLYIPFYVLCFVFMGVFLTWGAKTGGRKGQKRAVTQFSLFAILFYIGVTVLLAAHNHDNPLSYLSLYKTGGYEAAVNGFTAMYNPSINFSLTINFYTILFIILYGCGYGAFNVADQMTIPMVADVTDYEIYRSGKYVPGIMGTLFSLVDKLISSLQQVLLLLFIVMIVPGLDAMPLESTPYMSGMKLSAVICFCALPMFAWLITLFCMTRYKLSGKRLEEIQAVNAVRKAAIAGGMTVEQAMETWKTIDQVPAEYIPVKKPRINKKTGKEIIVTENWFDRLYKKLFTKRERVTAEPSVNAIAIPAEFAIPIEDGASVKTQAADDSQQEAESGDLLATQAATESHPATESDSGADAEQE